MQKQLKRGLALCLTLLLVLGMFPHSFAAELPFTDVAAGAWYEDAVAYVYERGMMIGTSATLFSPNMTVTRGMIITTLYRAAGRPKTNFVAYFTDVSKSKYYAVPVTWAVENGITTGTSATKFSPEAGVTREQLAVFLFRFAEYLGWNTKSRADLSVFPDSNKADPYAVKALQWAVAEGVINGVQSGSAVTLQPRSTATRAQVAQLLRNFFEEADRADKSALKAAVEEAEALQGADYTLESWTAVKEALEAAHAVLDNNVATQREVDAALAALLAAVEGLQEVELPVSDIDLALDPHHGTILHTWCWNLNTVRENMSEIAAAGFSSIQVSPIASCAGSRLQINGGWYYHYQPNEYIIGNYQMGTRDDFIAMCEEAHRYGITVIVDTVINHVTTSTVHEAITSIPNWRHNNSGSWNQDDRYHLTQFALSGLPDLNTQNPEIQQMLKAFLVDCVQCGADGFRFDAAKLIELPDDTAEGFPDFASDFWPIVLDNGATFQYGEDLQEGNEPIIDLSIDSFSSRLGAYQQYMNTTASFYGWMLRDQVEHDDLTAAVISDWLLPEDASEDKIITWVESHDNYCNDASYRELDEQEVIQAWAVIAGRRGGTPLFFDRPMNSTSTNPWGNDRIGPAGSNMYKDPQVVAVNFMRNELGDAEEALYNPNGDTGVLIIERGHRAAVIINVHNEPVTLENVPVVNLADGVYPDQAGGSSFTVKGGKLSGTVAAGRVAVAYDRKGTGADFAPAIDISVPSCDFITDSITVALNVRGCDSAFYQIDGGEEIPFADGTILTLGAELAGDESLTLSVTGVKGDTVLTASATYTKRVYHADTIVYVEDLVRVNRGWGDRVYIYLWGNGGTNNGSWPGVLAELQSEGEWAGYWKYVLPFELESISGLHVIVNNGSGGGNNQIERSDMIINPHEIRVMEEGEAWVDATNGYHKHQWGEGVTMQEPNCTEAGAIAYVCSICGEVKTESIPALGHAWDEGAETTPPGCTSDGVMRYTCGRCGTIREDPLDAIGHAFENGVCTHCGATDPNLGLTGYVLAAQPPKPGDKVLIAAETATGYTALRPYDFNRNPATGVDITVEGRVAQAPADNLIWTVTEGSYNSFTGLCFTYGTNNLRFNSNRIRLQNNKQYGTFTAIAAGEDHFKLRCDQNSTWLNFAGTAFTVGSSQYPIVFFVLAEAEP